MAKRANYGFEKRQKELKRQKKKDRKAEKKSEKKRMKKESAVGGDQGEVPDGGDGDLGSVDDSPSDPDLKSDGGG